MSEPVTPERAAEIREKLKAPGNVSRDLAMDLLDALEEARAQLEATDKHLADACKEIDRLNGHE